MAIEIKEYIGATFTEQNHHGFNPINLTESTHYSNRVAPDSLMVDIEGLHSVITRNDTFYTDEAMKSSAKYWTVPYERPVIMHHNEKDGITIGRVKSAYWTDKNTRSGTGALRFVTNIGHKEGLEGINNGSLSTVSVGLIAHDVRCSICGEQVSLDADGTPECGHYKGASYDDKHCYWIIHEFEPKELSFVIVPSDPFAHILRVYKPDNKDLKLSESNAKNTNEQEVNNMYGNPFMDLIEETNESIKDIVEEASKDKAMTEAKAGKSKEEEEVNDNNNVQSNSDDQEPKEKEQQESNEEDSKEEAQESDEAKNERNSESESDETVDSQDKTEEAAEAEENQEESNESVKTSKIIEEEVKKDIDSPKEDIYKDIEVKLKKAETENETLKEEIANLTKQVAEITNKLQTEKSLKESAEAELMEFRTERKKNLAEQVNALRVTANLEPEKVENLMEASEDTLHFTIKNLKEFSSQMVNLSKIPKLQSEVSISESKDNTQKTNSKQDVKESKSNSNINLEENMEEAVLGILSRAFNGEI